MDWLTAAALVISGLLGGGGIAALVNAHTHRGEVRSEQERADDEQDLAELRAIIAEQRKLIDEYRREYALHMDRIDRLEGTVKWQGVKIAELMERDEDCRQQLALARAEITELRRAS